ncbi:MAG: GxxExxY protein [Cellvibrionaceae bacterium]|jgi:GxxExxY protein
MKSGWSEEIYHQALLKQLLKHNIPTLSKPRFPIIHRGKEVYQFEPDIIVWDEIILELKVNRNFKGREFPSINEAQIIHYLKCCKKELGILVNFAHTKVGIKRMIYHPPEIKLVEVYDHIKSKINNHDRSILKEVRKHLLNISHQYGTGYSDTVYRNIIELELNYHGLKYKDNVIAHAEWEGERIGSHEIPHLLVEDRILVLIRASFKHGSTLDFTSMQSYLNALDLNIGIVMNFGRDNIQINGVAV